MSKAECHLVKFFFCMGAMFISMATGHPIIALAFMGLAFLYQRRAFDEETLEGD